MTQAKDGGRGCQPGSASPGRVGSGRPAWRRRVGGMSLALLLLWCAAASAATGGEDYPFADPLVATILGTPPELRWPPAEKMDVKLLSLTIFPDRKIPDVFWYNSQLRCSLAKQKAKAPLIFVIAGTGSGFNCAQMQGLQSTFYRAGFHVVCISSPTQANFITTASTSRIPGILKEDARDLYRVMQQVWKEVRGEIQVSDFYLTGYSLGGSQAAFVSMIDEQEKSFNFRKVLMINPAVSLYASAVRMDHLLEDNIPGGVEKTDEFVQSLMDRLTQVYTSSNFVQLDNQFLFKIYRNLPEPPKDENLAGVIGLAFRIAGSNMIFASDVMTHSGFVVAKKLVLQPSDSLDPYFRTLLRISFAKYMDEMLLPATQLRDPKVTREALIEGASLKSIDAYLRHADKIGVMTNQDDIILSPEELAYLRELFGTRAMVFPHGGHLGNLDQRSVAAYLTNFFTQSSTRPEDKR